MSLEPATVALRLRSGTWMRVGRSWARGAQGRGRGPIELVSLAAGLGIWQIVSISEPHLVPGLQQIASAARAAASSGTLWSNIGDTMRDLAIGFAISLAAGLVLGVAMALSPSVAKAVDMYVGWMLAVPEVAVIPFLVAALGYGYTTRIVVVIVFAFPVIVQRVMLGVQHVPLQLVDMARSYEVPRAQYLRKVVVPASLPSIMVGIRLGFARSMLGIVAAGFLIQLFGLGGSVYLAEQQFQVPNMFFYVLVIIVISLLATRLIQRLDRVVTHWNVDAGRG